MIPYASRTLGPIGIGSVQYAQSWVSYFSLLSGLGISSYAVREGAKIRDNPKRLGKFSTEIMNFSVFSTAIAGVLFLQVTSRFMRKIVCRLRLNRVSQQWRRRP